MCSLTHQVTFIFKAMDINHLSCLPFYKLLNDPSKTIGLHFTIHIKEDILIESCVDNYATFDGLVNRAHGIFKTSTYNKKTIIWIMFQNSKNRILIKKLVITIMTTLNQNGHQLNLSPKT